MSPRFNVGANTGLMQVLLLPSAKRGSNRRTVNLRAVAKGQMYILSTGCQWRAIAKDVAPRSTVYDAFDR